MKGGFILVLAINANHLSIFSNVKYTGLPGLGDGDTLSRSPWGLGFCRLSKALRRIRSDAQIAMISEPKRLVLSYIRGLFGMYKIFILRN